MPSLRSDFHYMQEDWRRDPKPKEQRPVSCVNGFLASCLGFCGKHPTTCFLALTVTTFLAGLMTGLTWR